MTLEMLYRDSPDSDAYTVARRAKVEEIAEYIRDFMREPQHALAVAETIMSRAENAGRIDGDEVGGELASRYTVSGNPLPFTV